jgi:hypothetical protein
MECLFSGWRNPSAAVSQVDKLKCSPLREQPEAALTKMADFAIALDFESSGLLIAFLSMFPERYP